jgi:hypothetical protein
MSAPIRTERGRYGHVIEGRIAGDKHARCNMRIRSFIPWGDHLSGRPAMLVGAGQVSMA